MVAAGNGRRVGWTLPTRSVKAAGGFGHCYLTSLNLLPVLEPLLGAADLVGDRRRLEAAAAAAKTRVHHLGSDGHRQPDRDRNGNALVTAVPGVRQFQPGMSWAGRSRRSAGHPGHGYRRRT